MHALQYHYNPYSVHAVLFTNLSNPATNTTFGDETRDLKYDGYIWST